MVPPKTRERLLQWRRRNSLSRAKAVALFSKNGLPMSESMLQKIEEGRRNVSPDTARRLSRITTIAFDKWFLDLDS